MKKEQIVQFVGFITKLPFEEFSATWDHYTRQCNLENGSSKLFEAIEKNSNRYKYISRHFCGTNDFRFAFMKDRSSEHFPEQTAKVVLMGGYIPLQDNQRANDHHDETKLMVFAGHEENDLEFYRNQSYKHLHIYQAYYENCSYGYIMEFIVQPRHLEELVGNLKSRNRIELAMVKESSLINLVK